MSINDFHIDQIAASLRTGGRTRLSVTLVCCSHQREKALRATVRNKLEVRDVDRLLFILDGCTDGSRGYLDAEREKDSRIDIVDSPRGGIQASRNFAIDCVETSEILFIDDDDFAPPEHYQILREKMEKYGAVAAGGPWLNISMRDGMSCKLAENGRGPGLRSGQETFYSTDQFTPFLNANSLVKTQEARMVKFDVGYGGNAWREETDFYIRLWAEYGQIVKTNMTWTWLAERYPGGHKRNRVWYEYWTARNELRFLTRNIDSLASVDPETRSVCREMWRSIWPRWTAAADSAARHLLNRGGLKCV